MLVFNQHIELVGLAVLAVVVDSSGKNTAEVSGRLPIAEPEVSFRSWFQVWW
jgi:hypothetical protein